MDPKSECLTADDLWEDTRTVKFGLLLIILLSVNFLVIAGNVLVVVTVAKCRKLRSVTNLFIVSLAFADLFLGIAILPFAIILELVHVWIFGSAWCSIWLAIDVWLSTASILNLMAISLDRYIAVMHPIRYPSLMSRKRAKILIAGVWVLAFIVCIPPLVNWGANVSTFKTVNRNYSMDVLSNIYQQNNSQNFVLLSDNYDYEGGGGVEMEHINTNCTDLSYLSCVLTTSKGYRIYSSIGSFYLPMCVMAFFYIRIYKTAVETAAALRKGTLTTKTEGENATNNMSITLRIHRGRGYNNTANWKDKKRKETNKDVPCDDNDDDDNNPQAKNHKQNTQQPTSHRKTKIKKKIVSEKTSSKGYVHTFKKFQSPKFPLMSPINVNMSSSLTQVCKNPSVDTASISSGSDIIEMNQTAYELNEQSNNSEEKHRFGLLTPGDQNRRRSAGFNFKVVRKHAKTNRSKFKRETKAAKTLAIIVGAFILCWLPFFTMYLVEAFCIDCIPPLMFSIFIWLGYCNSALNPCIYAMFSRDFRYAFKMLLTCRKYTFQNAKENSSHIQRSTQIHSVLRESDSLSEF